MLPRVERDIHMWMPSLNTNPQRLTFATSASFPIEVIVDRSYENGRENVLVLFRVNREHRFSMIMADWEEPEVADSSTVSWYPYRFDCLGLSKTEEDDALSVLRSLAEAENLYMGHFDGSLQDAIDYGLSIISRFLIARGFEGKLDWWYILARP